MIWFIIIGVILIIAIVVAIKEEDGSFVGLVRIPLCALVLASGVMTSALTTHLHPTTQLASTETKILYKLNEETSPDEITYFKVDSEKNQGWCLAEDNNTIGKDYLSIDMGKAKIFEISEKETPYLIQEKYEANINTAKRLFCMSNNNPYYKHCFYVPESGIKYDFISQEEVTE